jgi:hypothetical protein
MLFSLIYFIASHNFGYNWMTFFSQDSHAKILKLPSYESFMFSFWELGVRTQNLTIFLFVIVILLLLIFLHSPTFVALSHTCKNAFKFKDNLTFLRWPISFIMPQLWSQAWGKGHNKEEVVRGEVLSQIGKQIQIWVLQ